MMLSHQSNPSLQYERESHGSLYGPRAMGKDPFCCCCIFETLIVTGQEFCICSNRGSRLLSLEHKEYIIKKEKQHMFQNNSADRQWEVHLMAGIGCYRGPHTKRKASFQVFKGGLKKCGRFP